MKYKRVGLVIVVVIVLLLGIFVWSTRYKLDVATELSYSELSKLIGNAAQITYLFTPSDDNYRFKCNIYNGSEWIVSEMIVQLTIKNSDGSEMLSRKYRLTSVGDCQPFESEEFSANLGFSLKGGQTWSWKIVSAKGTKK